MTRQGRPIRFLATVVLLWVGGRVLILWPAAAEGLRDSGRHWIYAAPLLPRPALVARAEGMRGRVVRIALNDPPVALQTARAVPARLATAAGPGAAAPLVPSSPSAGDAGIQPALVSPAPRRASRLALSAWAIVRPGGGGSLAGGGQLGGSQAGVRLHYALTPAVAIEARLSAPIDGPGRKAALGVAWRPVRTAPVWIAAERRVRDGPDAFAVGAFGGVDGVTLPARFSLDGYGQAGVVGLKRRQAYADGAVRMERTVVRRKAMSLAIGGGLWGAAQPGAARLDIGPQLVGRIPLGVTTLRAGLDWRHRIAGDARPGSGPALSVGADF